MFDPRRIDAPSLDLIDRVVTALVSGTAANDASIMVIGAHSRDLLHTGFGRTDVLRSTNDVDIAIAVKGHPEYQRIVSALPRSGTTDVRYAVAGIAVDVVPFGDIEDPAGTTPLPGRTKTLDVFGFQEVFAHSIELRLRSGHRVRIPAPAGYTALKLKAWCDRSVNGEYKDSGDIAAAAAWYQQDDDVRALLFGPRTDLLIKAEVDTDVASLYLLGEEIAGVLGSVRVAELATAWASTDLELLAQYFARQRSKTNPDRAAAHRAIAALTTFLAA
ncbi:hypothetical protein [Nocardia sp. XZ_19_369]|uniref:hypothetical protein n=1 Tax=Nocardia sp. XZ_19_369 TaxID=2769487 RepID=UPI00188DEBF3|nr:hypothetical protein [Nocardia sp. XZ_19_369]